MTIMEALHRIDTLKPNTYSNPEKIRWLSILDGIIYTDIIQTHEGEKAVAYSDYDDEVDLSTSLLVPAPYDDIYIQWLSAQIDYTNGEYGKYNNAMIAYNTAYIAFAKHYNAKNKPKSSGRFKF